MLRIYGGEHEHLFRRSDELRIFRALSDAGVGPRLLGDFRGGRVEAFVTGEVRARVAAARLIAW